MDLLQNPFYLLNATTRDNRKRIMTLSEERCLLLDADKCTHARSILTNPRKRLSAEISWLPGLRPKRIAELLSLLTTSVMDILHIDNLTPIAYANLVAAGVTRLPNNTSAEATKWITELARAFEDIDSETLCDVLNEERTVSGFPEITDLSGIESEIQEQRRFYRDVIKQALDKLPTDELVAAVTTIANEATNNGQIQAPLLIDDMISTYEVEAQEFLAKEEENIKIVIGNIRGAVEAKQKDTSIFPMITQLSQLIKNWTMIARPIQVARSGQGLDHEASRHIAICVRELAIYLFNEHDRLAIARQLTSILKMEFAGNFEISDLITEDANTLEEISRKRVRDQAAAEERRREITYTANLGILFKDKLSISPEGIEWENRLWDLDTIEWVTWGGTRNTINGIPTGTTYTIRFGTDSELCHITLSNSEIFGAFTERLWKAVGVRLLIEYLEGLRDGKKYRFGAALISDFGMEFESYNFFSKNDRIFCRWSELVIWDGPGVFCVGKRDNRKFSETFSYQDEKNIHVLEAMVRTLWKRGGDKLSSLLGEG